MNGLFELRFPAVLHVLGDGLDVTGLGQGHLGEHGTKDLVD